jgi:hypothetical protein
MLNFFNGAVVISALVTMTGYHFILVPAGKKQAISYNFFSFSDIVIHYVVPLLAISDWLFFAKKGLFAHYYPFLWVIPFLIYFFAVFVRAKFGGILEFVESKYPYYFIDLHKLGIIMTLRNIVIISCATVLLGYVLFFLDYLLTSI